MPEKTTAPSAPSPANDPLGLGPAAALARVTTPDALVSVVTVLGAIAAVLYGVQPFLALSFGFLIVGLYTAICLGRMWHEQRMKQLEVDALYGNGEAQLKKVRQNRPRERSRRLDTGT